MPDGPPAGDSQGGGSPLVGGAGRTVRASAFGWLATCPGVGGTRPPRLSPGGGNGKGGVPNSLLPQANPAATLSIQRGRIRSPHSIWKWFIACLQCWIVSHFAIRLRSARYSSFIADSSLGNE